MRLTTIIATSIAFVEAISIPSTGTTSLREEATKSNLLLGSGAINPFYLNASQFRAVLSKQFNSLTPENELKWNFVHPAKSQYDWRNLDRLVKFADANNMEVKGHALRAEITNHFVVIIHRYHGKIDRWDVVSEALKTNGSGLAPNHFYGTLGPSWVEDAFRIARAADPDAKLFLNENLVEVQPKKRQELYDMVSELVHKGVPIDGIALQMHITREPLVPGVIQEMVESYRALGLQVTIAEMDVHTYNVNQQAEIYGDTVKEALDAGITDISFWGFTDKHLYTWLPGAKPLMFNETYHPKSAFYSTHYVLTDFNERS
ncbi:glycosyl hydrolase family 10 [Fusarium phyllophilum]|uniref:Beta-xylanase n=1 Tax=Fusarium phyllophilum TaxID=47803 RepID=A0A8H5IVV4_9HYPO|nr:glycosyl hydrolase family 10 [Fusarium phyllophilum]